MADRNSEVEGLGETLIPAINKLQDICNQVTVDLKLDLPQVAVVGSQSSGKSSVLEALVGRDFLPRGPNIVTRRPLVLQLVKQTVTGSTSKDKSEWGEFLHLPGKRFYDFSRIREEIQAETDRLTGTNKGVSDQPIRLKINSPNVLTMTLVDLPGIARLPVGDQPTDIEARIRRMVVSFISNPTCIILAVTPANQDIVNSDALELARSVDPEGYRTIGVLSKLDIMDRGTDAVSVLKNEVVPLRLGYVGVVNRSQEDINNQQSMSSARGAERKFFDEHPEYREVWGQCGMQTLAQHINTILVEHIRGLLPSLRLKIESEVERRAADLRLIGDEPPGQTNAARGALLLQLLDSYATRFAETLEGTSCYLPVSELAGGARIRHIFQDIFVQGLNQLDPSSELSDDDIRTAIKNSGGVRGSLLIPDAPFELLVRRAIARLLPPALQCKDFVYTELLRIGATSVPPDVSRFPLLQRQLAESVESFIGAGAAPAERMIRDLVQCEHAYINTDHPQFIGGNKAIAQVLERRSCIMSEGDDHGRQEEGAGQDNIPHGVHKAKSTGALSGSTPSGVVGAASASTGVGVSGSSGGVLLRPKTAAAATDGRVGLKQAVEVELLSPGELLGNGSEADKSGSSGGGGWFANLFGRPKDQPPSAEAPLRQPPQTLKVQSGGTDQEQVQVEVTRVLVESYFDIVRKNLQDGVPKAVMHFLVNHVQRGLQQHLIKSLYNREELFDDIMAERGDIAQRRQECIQALRALRTALTTLDSLPSQLTGWRSSSTGDTTSTTTTNMQQGTSGGKGVMLFLMEDNFMSHTALNNAQWQADTLQVGLEHAYA